MTEYTTNHPKEFEILERKTLRLGWPIPDDDRSTVVKRQVQNAIDPNSTSRDASAAARCLAAMNGQNLALAISHLNDEADKLEPVSTETLLIAMRAATTPGKPETNTQD